MKFLVVVIFGLSCSSLKNHSMLSVAGCMNKSKPIYLLPFPVGTSYYLLQGNCGKHSHFGKEKFAYDFRMPVGSVITAMRSGKVVNLQERFIDGTNNNDSLNFIIILHDDSTASRYLHITQNGALVRRGEYVNAGDTIGLSGNSGLSTEPHLHVDVTGYCTHSPCQTLPFSFMNCTTSFPVQGKKYLAIPL